MVRKVSKYMVTDGENYISDPNGTRTSINRTDAFLWNSKDTACNILNYTVPSKGRRYHVQEVITYEQEISEELKQEMEMIKWFSTLVKDCAKNRDALNEELSEIDRLLSDINHFIEFTNLNAVDGYRIYKKQHELLKRRREVKYELKIADDINSLGVDEQKLDRLVGYFKNQRYVPRVQDFSEILD